jgi:hypothetical protein
MSLPNPLLLGLSVSLIIGITGASIVAYSNEKFAVQYGRIVEMIVSGSLGAVAGGGVVALSLSKKESRPVSEETLDA